MSRKVAEYREFQDGELIAGTRYRVVKLIGVGGMGTVYEVEHVELQKRFVLKALLRELSRRQDLVIRLRNEWRALGRLEHPNIVTVTDAGTSGGGVPFYVMERLEGETLAQRMRRTRRFVVREAVEIAVGVLEGLAAAHQIGVVHRDVKPPNVFLLSDGKPKVLDFGVAKIADDPGVVTARGVAVGTPRYMSPEQARGEAVDGRADVYSSGLILFEIIAGVSPFEDARDANELILAHLARRPPPLSSLVMGVPAALDRAVAGMLEKSRDERPASAVEAAAWLREVLATAFAPPIPDRAPPSREREARSSVAPVAEASNTTRPDGVAMRPRPTATSVSAPGLSWLERPTLPQLAVESGATSSALLGPSELRVGVDTLIGLPPTEFPESLSPHVTNADGRISTEILTAAPAREPEVTRTLMPSETPPPVSPMPEAAPLAVTTKTERKGRRWAIPLALGAVIAGISLWSSAPLAPRTAAHSEPAPAVPVRPRTAPQLAPAPVAAPQAPKPALAAERPERPERPEPSAVAPTAAPRTGPSAAIPAKSKARAAVSGTPEAPAAASARAKPKPRSAPTEIPAKTAPDGLPSSGL